MYSCQVLDKNVTNINFCYRLSNFLSINVMKQIIKQVVPLKYSKILNISQYNHRLSTTIITLLNFKDKRSKLQKLGNIYSSNYLNL